MSLLFTITFPTKDISYRLTFNAVRNMKDGNGPGYKRPTVWINTERSHSNSQDSFFLKLVHIHLNVPDVSAASFVHSWLQIMRSVARQRVVLTLLRHLWFPAAYMCLLCCSTMTLMTSYLYVYCQVMHYMKLITFCVQHVQKTQTFNYT